MADLFEDILRFESDDPAVLLRQISTRAAQVADVGGTIHAIDVTYQDADGSATMIVTVTEDQARLLSYDADDLENLLQQPVEPGGR